MFPADERALEELRRGLREARAGLIRRRAPGHRDFAAVFVMQGALDDLGGLREEGSGAVKEGADR